MLVGICGGQNKNQYIALAMIYIVNTIEKLNVTDIRFSCKGYTFLPDDSNFGNIQKKIKARELLYSADDYVDVISQCYSYGKEKKGLKKKLKVHVMKQVEFKNFTLDDLLVKRTVLTKNESLQWSLIHHMQFKVGSSCMWFKYKSFGDSSFGKVQLIRRDKSVKDIEKHVLQPLHNTYCELRVKSTRI